MDEFGVIDTDNRVLTTIDNPYNPKVDYDKWKTWDEENGYYTESFIVRLMDMEEVVDIEDEFKFNEIANKVIDEILENDILGIYILV